jgi:hypothetical protein
MATLAIRAFDTGEVIIYQLFEAAVWPNYAALAKWKPEEGWPRLVRRYHPGGTSRPLATFDIRHATVWARPATINAAWRGLPLLEQVGEPRGGRRKGWRKGLIWDHDAFQGWKSDRDLEGKPATLPALAEALGVKDPETAHQRLRELSICR